MRKLFATVCALLSFVICCIIANGESVIAEETAGYSDGYRNALVFSAMNGWNNDPNGLVYIDGTYHMYYQYNYKDGGTANVWGNMSWGHATSTDLVHWQEKPVAISAYQTDTDGNYYGMMFSGSVVYDKDNSSGLFEKEGGSLKSGHGMVAILTQPLYDGKLKTDAQRQILAYSLDGGDSFEIYGEVLAGIPTEDGKYYRDFRDPKVFWSDTLEKWLMVVGGGAVRMYGSDNLRDWRFIGETGFWGECPDLVRFNIASEDSETPEYKYALIISPEDKNESHEYNGTTRADTYYPAEYYVVGDLDDDGLFVAEGELTRFGEGIDSYAFQSFNGVPDGKVYGISWAASWKSVNEYSSAGFKRDFNGGMTVTTELQLVENDDGYYYITRNPIAAYNNLRSETAKKNFDGTLTAGVNAFAGVNADIADIALEADFTDGNSTELKLDLRVSDYERVCISYDVKSGVLALDRSQSSLLASCTSMYKSRYNRAVGLVNGKLNLRIILDRAFISMFANDGEASFFAAIFPSAYSTRMELTADGDIKLKADVYSMTPIFDGMVSRDELFVSARTIDTVVGATEYITAYSFGAGADKKVTYSIKSGGENIELIGNGDDGIAIKAKKSGNAEISIFYGGAEYDTVALVVRENGLSSDVRYVHRLGGTDYYIGDDGLHFNSNGEKDAFLFSADTVKEFTYSATFTPVNNSAQAAGLVFGVRSGNTHYYVATFDRKDKMVKLWQSGVGDLVTAKHDFTLNDSVRLTVVVLGGRVSVCADDSDKPLLEYEIKDYAIGAVGLCLYNAEMNVDDIVLRDMNAGTNSFDFGSTGAVRAVIDSETGKYLSETDYTIADGVITLSAAYLKTVEFNSKSSTIDVVTDIGTFKATVIAPQSGIKMKPAKDVFYDKSRIALELSDSVTVLRLTLDGRNIKFEVNDNNVIIDCSAVRLAYGKHTLSAYTESGKLSAVFTYADKKEIESAKAPEKPVVYTYLIIDIFIFAAIIIVFSIVSYIGRRKVRMQ